MKTLIHILIGVLIGTAAITCFAFNEVDNNQIEGTITLHKKIEPTDPSCLQMYYYIEQYADSFDIPINYAFGIAHNETGYDGPFDWKYNHKQSSKAGAQGPMQVLPTTAKFVNGRKVASSKLRLDIEYNIMTSMKLLRRLHDKYKNWKVVFGYYNTGRPIINKYALRVYNYTPSWKVNKPSELILTEAEYGN